MINRISPTLLGLALFAATILPSSAVEVKVVDITESKTSKQSTAATSQDSTQPALMAVTTATVERTPSVIAHRGGKKWAPENTMAAFKKAIELGADGIELDIHKCKTGELVVIHDADISRTTNGVGAVPDLTFDELTKASAGVKFGSEFTSERIPLLSDVLKLIDGKLVLNIEVKNWPKQYPGLDDDLVTMLKSYPYPDRIVISSFDHEILKSIHKKAPQYKIAVLDTAILLEPKSYTSKVGATIWNPDFHTLRADVVQRAKRSGLKVNVWTVNLPSEWEQAVSMGVDGIITDDTPGLIEFLRTRKSH